MPNLGKAPVSGLKIVPTCRPYIGQGATTSCGQFPDRSDLRQGWLGRAFPSVVAADRYRRSRRRYRMSSSCRGLPRIGSIQSSPNCLGDRSAHHCEPLHMQHFLSVHRAAALLAKKWAQKVEPSVVQDLAQLFRLGRRQRGLVGSGQKVVDAHWPQGADGQRL